MHIGKVGGRSVWPVVGALLLGATLLGTTAAFAKDNDDKFYPPEQAGRYGIGHTTVVITDPARNLDGSSPATSSGRFLHLDIWYPTTVKTTQHIRYTWNNPLYNQNPGGSVYPGLPDLPALTALGSVSLNPITDNAPLAKAEFPLLIASHGNLVSSAKNMPDTLETLASHGYIVASIEHTGNDDAWYQANFINSYVNRGNLLAGPLPIGPNPRLGTTDLIAQRSKDVRFVIDAVLQGTVDQRTGIAFSKPHRCRKDRSARLFTGRANQLGHGRGHQLGRACARQPGQGGFHGGRHQLRAAAEFGGLCECQGSAAVLRQRHGYRIRKLQPVHG